MKRLAILSIVFAFLVYIILGFKVLLLFATAFFLIGLSKIIKLLFTRKTDLKEYGIWNFLYGAGPQIVFALGFLVFPGNFRWIFAVACGLATVSSDTTSCEIGKARGGITKLITTWKKVEPGVDGGISFAGTLTGIIVSSALAFVTRLIFPSITITEVVFIAILGFMGNIFDSILGATLQKAGYVNNEQVNGISITLMMVVSLVINLFIK